MSRAGFAPHGIRGAFNIIEDQVAIVARLETFMCTDPPRRDSRLRFLVPSQDSRDALLPSRSSTTRHDAPLRAAHHDPDLDLDTVTKCCLLPDFDQFGLARDQTEIGEKGAA